MTKQHSIKVIARLCNVSIITVSRVINNSGHFSKKIKRKVFEVVRRIGNKIDYKAQSLHTIVNSIIGILVPYIRNHIFTENV